MIVDTFKIFLFLLFYHTMSNTMELSERLIPVRSSAKHEKDFPSFTQDDIVFLFGDVTRPLGLILNNSDPWQDIIK